MRQNNAWLWIVLAALVGIFLWGLEQVAFAPLETGDVYPPYSTLRSDPLGAKALYDSLAALPSPTVERLYRERAALGRDETLFVMGVDPIAWSSLDDATLAQYEKLIENGGRLVIAFVPVRAAPPGDTRNKAPHPVEKRWNLTLNYRDLTGTVAASGALPRETALYFEGGPQWTIDGTAERKFGSGTIVLVADSFPLSDQGLREARDAALISRLVGPARRVVFDENHFGVVETGSAAKLIRNYRLEGAVAVLALAAALFLWRSASSFLPPRESSGTAAVAGADSLDGMTALLRRGIPEKDLLDACVTEWSKLARNRGHAAHLKEVVRESGKDPVEAYRAACDALPRRPPERRVS